MSPSEEGNKVSSLLVNIRDSNDGSCEISITLYKIYFVVDVKIIINLTVDFEVCWCVNTLRKMLELSLELKIKLTIILMISS